MSENNHIKRYAYIDALRGYAILMVIAVHSSLYFSDLPHTIKILTDQGARGVQLFFVASALTLCLSWRARGGGLAPFYVRRLFRIAPMFWLAMVFFLTTQGLGPRLYAPDGIGPRHIAMTALFLHGLLPDTITSVVPGGWSVADEVAFYAIFPLLFFALSRMTLSRAIVSTIVVTLVCILISRIAGRYGQFLPEQDQGLWGAFIVLWFPRQFPCFIFGMLIFKIATTGHPPSRATARVLVVASAAAMVAIPLLENVKYITPLGLPITYGSLFAIFSFGLMAWQPKVIVNNVIGWIGKISFSGYLIHLALISRVPLIRPFDSPTLDFTVMFAIIGVLTVAISSVTYLMIERPMIKFGNLLIDIISRRALALA
jgi:peptidoglycan/LPS O-acetylase OafA/YrhL